MICSSPQTFASSFSLHRCRQRIHFECLARSVHACGDHCPFCTQDLVSVLSDPLAAASFEHLNIPIDFTRPLRILRSILSVSQLACHILLPFSPSVAPTVVDLQISNPWMTAEWNGLPFSLLPKAPHLLGFFNGSVVHAVRPLPCRTSLLFPQSRALSALPLLLSSLTGPLDALCVSAFPVNSLSLTTVPAPHLSLLFHQRLFFHPTMNLRLTGSRTVLCRGSHHSTVGDVVTPLLPALALSLGSSAL